MSKPDLTAKDVASMLNSMGPQNSKKFIDVMSNEHRTLQQRFTQLCIDWLAYCDGMKSNQYDGRNEASKEIANKMFDFMEREEISYNRKFKVPFI